MTNNANLSLFDNNADMTKALVAEAELIIRKQSSQTLLLSGGSSPCDFYEALGQQDLPWADIDIALVDERWVGENDAGSNAALIKRTLMSGAAQAARFTPMKTTASSPHEAAEEVNGVYRNLPKPNLCILGMGPDTHTASWFSQAAEYDAVSSVDAEPLVAGLKAPESPVTGQYLLRMTITGAMLALSGTAFLIVKGDDKIALLENCLAAPLSSSPIGRAAAILGPRLQIFALRDDG